MSQLKFVRSKSTIRSNPLGKLQSKLKLVQKPGKLHVSVGRSRQSSQTNEDLLISNPKHQMDLQVLQLHQINENTIPLQTSDICQSIILPLSHDARLINNSRKFSNSTQYNGNWANIYNQQHYQTQTTCCSPKLSENENIFKFDVLQFKSNKLNSTDQKSISISDTNLNSKFNFNQFSIKQTIKQNKSINQVSNLQVEQLKQQTNINTKIKQNQMSIDQQIQQKSEQLNLDQNKTFNLVNTKPIIELNENQLNEFSTKQSQRQIPKSFSEIMTERSIVLNVPKEQKDIQIQTSFSQNNKYEPSQSVHLFSKSTTNASVQTKSKNKNLGLFQYQLSYLSPKINRNFQESDLISLDDYQQQFIYGTQQEYKNKMKQINNIDQNQQLIQSILRQQSNIDLDSIEDSKYFNLQAEPKEINMNIIDKKFNNNNKRSISKVVIQNNCSSISKNKIDKGCSLQSSKSYKEHLNILTNQQNSQDQNQPFIVLDKKQRYPLRNQSNIKKSKYTTKK
ncbi:unnamed protein product [Paramecium pentaurelia]|uniref:Uncharacterized protein n=1 Tax=Paramecium pentaurelia TaxID=43138 RepID=A0A8S1Y9W7_9CILI|nr:unnamed protein product [Paramecium pentaurelia]